MKIAIVNDIHVGKALEHLGKVRASSHLIEERLESFLQAIQQQHRPDLFVNLGDLIRSEERECDMNVYRRLMKHFKRSELPVIHLIGNHELKKMSLSDIESIWLESGFMQKSYGSRDVGDFTLVWLGLEEHAENPKIRSLPKEQLAWLKEALFTENHHRPTILFTHCAMDDHDVSGNFFYEAMDHRNNSALFLHNQVLIREAITRSGCVVVVLQAHLHHFHVKQIDGVSYITCPAMGDNICGPNAIDNIPEIYTLLTVESGRFTVKAFSRRYCFAGYEEVRKTH